VIDVALLFGRIVFIALMYLFLFAAVRAGLGLVKGGSPARSAKPLALLVTAGPAELRGVKVPLTGRVRIGRAPDLELVIADDFVSTHHVEIISEGGKPQLTDLGSTNGTVLNGRAVTRPVRLGEGDEIVLGTVHLKVGRL
jgi:pSer/pThr/pTyr-binding forkhead associated (FHA) protein